MKKIYIVAGFFLFAGTMLFSQNVAQGILEKADAIFLVNNAYSKVSLEIVRSKKAQAVQEMEGYSIINEDGTSKSLQVFTAPARVKGTAYLTIEDDLWVKFSSTGRTRKLSSSAQKNSAAGSDFSYSDMGNGDQSYSKQYNATVDGEDSIDGSAMHRLVLIPKEEEDDGDLYEKLVVWISKDKTSFRRIEFYEDGAAIKVMNLADYKEVQGLAYPFKITMNSLTRDSISTMTTTELELDSPKVQEKLFSTRYLESLK